jgi:hypothetical protein
LGRKAIPLGLRDQHRAEQIRGVVAAKRALPGERLEEAGAEGPHVAAPIDRLALRLLRTHVGGGAEDLAALRGLERQCRRV